jgi:hypothetical protein
MEFINNFLSRFNNANEIISGNLISGKLFLGDYHSALDPTFLAKNNITVIANISVDIPFIDDILEPYELQKYGINKLEKFRISVFDSLLEHDINLMTNYLPHILPFLIKKLINEKKNVLIHCHAGRQRSLAVVLSLLYTLIQNDIMVFSGIYLPEKTNNNTKLMKNIIKFVQKKRPCVASYGLRINFRKSLCDFFNIKF